MGNKAPKVALISLGCPKNLVDSEVMLGCLQAKGFELTTDLDAADAIIVNTCAFIDRATEESKETLRQAAQRKLKGKCQALICAGCLPQRHLDELLGEFPEMDAFVGVNSFHRIAEILSEVLEGHKIVDVTTEPIPLGIFPRLLSTPPWMAYLKIAEGCDNTCSFCTIPSIRGPQRSRTVDSLVKEAHSLAASGVKELNLVAQDTTRYGTDLHPPANMAQLLQNLLQIQSLHWIRLLYGHPAFVTDELIDTIASSKKICRYLDLPIQHVSPRILRLMKREGSAEEYHRLFETLREQLPGLALRTTVMVGFPGETEQEFEELLDFIEKVRFDRLGIFTYRREEGTEAAHLQPQIPEKVKEERLQQLVAEQQQISLEINQSWVGKQLEVLVEGIVNGRAIGRSRRDAPEVDGEIIFEDASEALQPGKILIAEITQAEVYDLFAKPVAI